MNDKPETPRTTIASSPQYEGLDSLGIVVREIAHDFNNILAQIFGYVEMALQDIPEGSRARSDLEHALEAGDRAKALVARMLTYSNRAKLRKQAIIPARSVRNALRQISDRMPKNIVLQCAISVDDCFVQGNDTELTQIVTQLCKNSMQAMPASGGRIDVILETVDKESNFFETHPTLPPGNYAVLTVRDTGCGMDASTMEKMYTPFFTTSRGDDNKVLRAGLGLTTVDNIVSSMNGYTLAKSSGGEGTTFEICLPLLDDEKISINPEIPGTKSAHIEKRVLFIDDEPAITEMASHILRQSGYKARFFIDGNEALQYFSKHPYDFDIIVTDLQMPKISGLELASRCAAINPAIPIVMTTGFSQKISLANCLESGVTTVIYKPFSIRQLLSTLEDLAE